LNIFSGIFGTRLIYRSLVTVTSSGEVSENCVAFRVLNAVPAEICSTDRWFHIGAISGGDFSIKIIISLVSEMEKKYSGTLMRFKGKIPVDSKALTSTPMEAALFQARPVGSLSENSSDSTDVWG
jgi:hypothetical protein